MSTVSKTLADLIIQGNGVYPGDEHISPVIRIVLYTNKFDGRRESYGLIYRGQPLDRYNESPSIIDPVVYWERPGG